MTTTIKIKKKKNFYPAKKKIVLSCFIPPDYMLPLTNIEYSLE